MQLKNMFSSSPPGKTFTKFISIFKIHDCFELSSLWVLTPQFKLYALHTLLALYQDAIKTVGTLDKIMLATTLNNVCTNRTPLQTANIFNGIKLRDSIIHASGKSIILVSSHPGAWSRAVWVFYIFLLFAFNFSLSFQYSKIIHL